MSLATIIAAVRNRRQAKANSILTDYRSLVSALANGGEVDEAAVVDMLEQVGKTESNLASDVEKFQQRQEWVAQVEAGSGAREREAELREKMATIRADTIRFINSQNQKIAELHHQAIAASALASQADSAERKLRDTCDDPQLLAEESEINSRLRVLRDQEVELTDRSKHRHDEAAQQELADVVLAKIAAERAKLMKQREELNRRKLEP